MIQAAQYEDLGHHYPVDAMEADNPFNCAYKTSDDRWLQLAAVVFDKYFPSVMKAIGREDLIGNERYTIANIMENHLNREFCEIMADAIGKVTLEELCGRLEAQDVPYGVMQTWEEVLKDPQAHANDVFYEMSYPKAKRLLVRTPVQMEEEGLPEYNPGPYLGQHTEEVIRSLGYSDAEIQALKEQNAFIDWKDIKHKYE